MNVLECAQRRATKLEQGVEVISCEEQLRMSGLSGLETKRQKCDFIAPCSLLRRRSGEEVAEVFSLGFSDRISGKSSKMCQGRVRLDVRKHFFTGRVKHWKRLPREVVNVSRLSVIKRHLDNALNKML